MLNDPGQAQPPPASRAQSDPKAMRRSSRLTLDVPVEVIYKGPQNKLQTEETRTFVVNAHGCGLSLKMGLLPGDRLVLIHKMSREEMTCRVVMCRQGKDSSWNAGLEFQSPSPQFWHIAFPPDDWDPSLRDHNAPAKRTK